MTERMISPLPYEDDRDEYSLRPKHMCEFIGRAFQVQFRQDQPKEQRKPERARKIGTQFC